MKKSYFVSVQALTIHENKEDAAFEFEINASQQEVAHLNAIFEKIKNADYASYWSTHLPYIPYHHDPDNDVYDHSLIEAYRAIHDLGTFETKAHIQSMGLDTIS